MQEKDRIILISQRNLKSDDPNPEDLFSVGVIGRVEKISDELAGKTKVIFEAENRVLIKKFVQESPFFMVKYEILKDDQTLDDDVIAQRNTLSANIKMVINAGKPIPLDIAVKILSLTDPNKLINNLVPILDISITDKEEILETTSISKRLELANRAVLKSLQVTEIEQKVAEKTQEEIEKTQKEVFLREELKAIQKELGDSEVNEFEEIKKNIIKAEMPEGVQSVALKELSHLEKTPSFSPEVTYIRNYLDWLISMPWNKFSKSQINLTAAKKILDEDHYGLEKVKERIIEYLAVSKMVGKAKGPILCFVGPPGTGKTSIGRSIARSLGRSFARISLGGIHDEAEIRGHRRTYVGSMPGRIIQGVRQSGDKNPVFMLDEIDKIGMDFRGDPSSALLEALDPEQNSNFSDHYLEVPFDLSDVIFITTANILETIPPALRDRMEMIEFPGYTPEEKFYIAKKFILPKIFTSTGLDSSKVNIDDDVIFEIITEYTLEAGVRNLERELSKIARKVAKRILENQISSISITRANIVEFLGQPKIEQWSKERSGEVGLVAGLAVTEAGGEVLSVEATFIPGGRGNLTLTGHLGDVMKESAQAALSYARTTANKYGVDPEFFYKNDVHVHVPRGAIPKDGPSAGVAIATAIISAMSKRAVDPEIGMTGEITLRGRVLKIGGLKEKILAARRSGLKMVIVPESNVGELSEIPEEYKKNIDFYLAKSMDSVLMRVLKG